MIFKQKWQNDVSPFGQRDQGYENWVERKLERAPSAQAALGWPRRSFSATVPAKLAFIAHTQPLAVRKNMTQTHYKEQV